MSAIQVKHFSELSPREVFCLSRIRDEVFVAEQKITVPELDDTDLEAYHVYLLNDEATDALAAARFFLEDGKYLIGRVAVQKAARRQGLASRMMAAIEQYVRGHGLADAVYLHAQAQAIPFYLANGYETAGEPFMEAGVAHQLMKKQL